MVFVMKSFWHRVKGSQLSQSVARRDSGFTLLELMIALAILSVSLTSLLGSQMASLRATSYAQTVTAASFLAEQQLLEIEWQMRKDGWPTEDRTFEGDFSDQGWPSLSYECKADYIELPEYSELVRAKEAGGSGAAEASHDNVMDAGEQAFGMLGMAWPIVKSAVEAAIRKASCTVKWKDGANDYEIALHTFWTDPSKLSQLPGMGGEATDGAGTAGSGQGASDRGASTSGSSGAGRTSPSNGSTTPKPGGGLGLGVKK